MTLKNFNLRDEVFEKNKVYFFKLFEATIIL